MARTGQPEGIGRSVLEGAFRLLEAVRSGGESGLSRLAAESGLPKATAHRLLDQLVALGAVERSRGRYRIGSRLFELGQDWQPHPGLLAASREPVRSLARATGASVAVCVLARGRTLAVGGVPGAVAELAPVRGGSIWPWPTAAGKVLVAGFGEDQVFGPLPPSWRRQAAEIRDSGFAYDDEEVLPGVRCVGVPIYAGGGREPVAALSAMVESGRPLSRLTELVVRVGIGVTAALRRWPAVSGR